MKTYVLHSRYAFMLSIDLTEEDIKKLRYINTKIKAAAKKGRYKIGVKSYLTYSVRGYLFCLGYKIYNIKSAYNRNGVVEYITWN